VAARFATVAVPTALVAAIAWASGGYFPRSWGVVLLAEAIVLACVAILADRIEVDRRALGLVALLLALAVWRAVSRLWAVTPDAAPLEAERTLLYAGAAAAALLAVPHRRAGELVLGVLGGTTAVTIGGLLDHVVSPGRPNDRLELPIGYANAAGIVAAAAALLGLGLATNGSRRTAALGAAVAVPATATLYLTLSRGALVAATLGLVVLAATSWSRHLVRLVLAAIPCVVALVIARLGSFDDPGFSGAELATLVVVAVVALGAGAVVARSPRLAAPRLPRALVVALAAVVVAGIVVVGVREIRDVRSAPASQQGAPDRLLSASTSFRSDYWSVAADMVAREPLLGEGAGGFERVWTRERPALLFARDAHNGYLETLAELGPLGLAFLVAALAVPLLGAVGAAASASGRAALAAYTALLAHVLLDWDLEMPAVTLCTVLLAAALVRLSGTGNATAVRASIRATLLVSAAVLAAAATVAHAGNVAIDDAHRALDRGDAAAARSAADRARRFAPWSAEPWRLLGEAELAAGRVRLARQHLRRAVAEDPGEWQTWLALAFASSGADRAAALERVRALDPLAPELDAFGSDADASNG
jgi:O-Antigen ligase/Tetratricopeptide repeat